MWPVAVIVVVKENVIFQDRGQMQRPGGQLLGGTRWKRNGESDAGGTADPITSARCHAIQIERNIGVALETHGLSPCRPLKPVIPNAADSIENHGMTLVGQPSKAGLELILRTVVAIWVYSNAVPTDNDIENLFCRIPFERSHEKRRSSVASLNRAEVFGELVRRSVVSVARNK
jgi:hypothetical protein